MKTPNATPTVTPWKCLTTGITGKNDRAVATTEVYHDSDKWQESRDENRANAAHIVKCVNSHEELLTAAQNALNVLAALATGQLNAIQRDSNAIQQLRNAIAKAEGGK